MLKNSGRPGHQYHTKPQSLWSSKTVEVVGGTLAVRNRRLPRIWGWVYVSLGASLIWYCFVQQAGHESSLYFGLVLGVMTSVVGLMWLLPAQKILLFDTTSQLVCEISSAWPRRRKVNTVPFASVVSIGTDTFTDPRNGAVWLVESVLRLTDGRRTSAGAPEDVETIARFAGLTVDQQIVWLEEPSNPSSG